MAANEQNWDFVIGGALGGESGAIDTVRTFDPKLGYWYDKPLRGEPYTAADGQVFPSKWHHDRNIEDLKRNLASCDHRLSHVDDPWHWWQGEPPTSEQIERKRAEIESEKASALAELERLEPASPPDRSPDSRSSGRRRRRPVSSMNGPAPTTEST